MRPLSSWLHLNFHAFPPDCSPFSMLTQRCLQNKAEEKVYVCLFTVYLFFVLFPFSVSDSTQRRCLCDRSRLQPRLWLYCQSHMWGEGGERGR